MVVLGKGWPKGVPVERRLLLPRHRAPAFTPATRSLGMGRETLADARPFPASASAGNGFGGAVGPLQAVGS